MGRISAKFSDASLWGCGSGWPCHFFLALQSAVGSSGVENWDLRARAKGTSSQPRHCSFSPCPVQTLTTAWFIFLLDYVEVISQSKWGSLVSSEVVCDEVLIVIYQCCFNSPLAKSRHSFYIPSSMALSSISNLKPWTVTVLYFWAKLEWVFPSATLLNVFFFFVEKLYSHYARIFLHFLPYSLQT